MILSIERTVDLGFHVLSDHFGCIMGVHYNVNNSLLILLHLKVLHEHTLYNIYNKIALQLGLYVTIWHVFYVLKCQYYINFRNRSKTWISS